MESFDELVKVADILNSPGGCPWDIKQTFESLARYVLEEAHEVVDAVHHSNDPHILEELGDLFYTVIFYGKVAEREGRFTLAEIIDSLREKLIRRHPHVFGEIELSHDDEVMVHWERIKNEEKGDRKEGAFDDIPKNLPILARAAKVLKRIRKHDPNWRGQHEADDFGEQMIQLILKCQDAGQDPETLLRKSLAFYEQQHVKNISK